MEKKIERKEKRRMNSNRITEEMILGLMEQVKAQQTMIQELKMENAIIKENGNRFLGGMQSMKVKPPKPEFYKGRRDAVEIDSWLDQIKRYGDHFKMSGSETANLAVFYLSGLGRDWWTNQPQIQKDQLSQDWNLFVLAVKEAFYPVDHQRRIMDALEKLRQKGSVASYVDKFEHLRTQIQGVSLDLWKRYFVNGLSPNIKIEAIKFNLDHPDASLSQLYQRLSAIGDAVWAQRTMHREDMMDLSYVDFKKSNGRKYAGQGSNKKTQGRRDFKCFKCGQSGHFKRDCKTSILNNVDIQASDAQDFQ